MTSWPSVSWFSPLPCPHPHFCWGITHRTVIVQDVLTVEEGLYLSSSHSTSSINISCIKARCNLLIPNIFTVCTAIVHECIEPLSYKLFECQLHHNQRRRHPILSLSQRNGMKLPHCIYSQLNDRSYSIDDITTWKGWSEKTLTSPQMTKLCFFTNMIMHFFQFPRPQVDKINQEHASGISSMFLFIFFQSNWSLYARIHFRYEKWPRKS